MGPADPAEAAYSSFGGGAFIPTKWFAPSRVGTNELSLGDLKAMMEN